MVEALAVSDAPSVSLSNMQRMDSVVTGDLYGARPDTRTRLSFRNERNKSSFCAALIQRCQHAPTLKLPFIFSFCRTVLDTEILFLCINTDCSEF